MTKAKIKEIVSKLTAEEKVSLLSGKDAWSTVPIPRAGIPSINLSDGPHGLRRCAGLGWDESVPATCFPPAALLACSFDEELAEKQGAAIGEEAQAQDVQIVLGPANNIKRSPLGGRSFEYLSEDPVLSGHMSAAIIRGIRSKKVGTALKHFACNSQETNRFLINERIGERALREIYLASFEYPVKNAEPISIMCAYNKINGVPCSENKLLLTDILRSEWGFKGFVMSDWGAVSNRAQALYAGLELEMPGTGEENKREILNALNGEKVSLSPTDKNFKNKLNSRQIDKAVTRLLEAVFYLDEKKTGKPCDYEKHHKLAAHVAKESMVLLKNSGALPIKGGKTAVIGEMAVKPRYQGGGSSNVNPIRVSIPLEEMKKYGDVEYADGYSLENENDFDKIRSAAQLAAECDRAVIFCGLPDRFESEGYDRKRLEIPESHLRLIEEVTRRQSKTIIVLCNGSPVTMPFAEKVDAILEAYLGGEAMGEAIADILYGKANPCGKLAETFPMSIRQTPAYGNFPGENLTADYAEGIYVGYRYYEKKGLKPLFPFGFGLSYTNFSYDKISLSAERINESDPLEVSVVVSNVGDMDGKEAVQLYVREEDPVVSRPEKELKAFKKIFLAVGESAEVKFTLERRDFAYWDEEIHDWKVSGGKFDILVGGGSDNCPLCAQVDVCAQKVYKPLTVFTQIREMKAHPKKDIFLSELSKATDGYFDTMAGSEKLGQSDPEWPLRTLVSMFDSKLTLPMLIDIINKTNEQS